MRTYKIGNYGGRPVRVRYEHQRGSLPEIHWSGGKSGSARGSSLGPANPDCCPDIDDLCYWQTVIGLARDEAQAARNMAAHNRLRAADRAAWSEAYIEDAKAQC